MPGQVSPTVVEEALKENLQGIRVNLEDLLKIGTPLVLASVIIKTPKLIEGLEEGIEIRTTHRGLIVRERKSQNEKLVLH